MASRARQKIEKAARQQGYSIYSAEYEPITPILFDELGGWCVKLYPLMGGPMTMVGGNNAEGVVGEIYKLPLRVVGRSGNTGAMSE